MNNPFIRIVITSTLCSFVICALVFRGVISKEAGLFITLPVGMLVGLMESI